MPTDNVRAYITRFKDTRRGPKSDHGDVIATICMAHGFIENSSLSYFETAIHHALNGFEVLMVDLKGFGYSHGYKGSHFTLFDQHEQLGAMLQQARTDKPIFLQGHSMGCAVITTFLLKNKEVNVNGIIYGGPFYGFHPSRGMFTAKRFLVELVRLTLGEVSKYAITLYKHYYFHSGTSGKWWCSYAPHDPLPPLLP